MKIDFVINLELNIDILNFGTTVGKGMMCFQKISINKSDCRDVFRTQCNISDGTPS